MFMETIMDKETIMVNYIREAHEKGAFTGTWLYAENGKIVSKGAIGFRDPENTLPMREDSIFDIASISKQFTAAGIMLLRRRGLLSLEDEITKYFPEIPYAGITIRHLLTHTSGFSDCDDDIERIFEEEGMIPDNNVILRILTECRPELSYPTGEGFEYTDTGYQLLAEIAEKVSGVPFEEFLKKNVFEPAGLDSTRVYHRRKDKLQIDDLAVGLVFEKGELILPEDSKARDYVLSHDGMNGNMAVYSNIIDLFKWDQVLREGSLLTPEEQKLMVTPATLINGEPAREEGDDDDYGFGWVLLHDEKLGLIACHSGYVPGYQTWFARYLDANAVLVQLCCREYTDVRAYVAFDSGMEAIVRGLKPEPIRSIDDIALQSPDKSGWEALCGKYEHPEDSDFFVDEVYMKEGELYAKTVDGDDEMEFRLYPIGENKFGRKAGMLELTFGDECLIYDNYSCKKL
jgi:CubicO group peptidase (beta-lactamase class C family)